MTIIRVPIRQMAEPKPARRLQRIQAIPPATRVPGDAPPR
jgi:hypothetical protein